MRSRARATNRDDEKMIYKGFSVPRDEESSIAEIYHKFDSGVEISFPEDVSKIIYRFLERVEDLKEEFRKTYKAKEIPEIWGRAIRTCKEICKDNLTALSVTTGFPEEALEVYLEAIFSDINEEVFRKIAESELDIEYIDGFKKSKIGYSKAYGPKYVIQILPGVPGPQLLSSFQSSIVKAPSIYKPPSEEPLFTNFWIESLKAEEPSLEKYLWVIPWRGGDEDIENELFSDEDSALIVYGDENTIKDIKSRAKGKVIGYPRRFGFEVIDTRKEGLSSIAQKIAKDVAYFDQLACFSPHVIYAIGTREKVKELSKELSKSLETIKLPRAKLNVDTKSVLSMLKATLMGERCIGLPVDIYCGKEHLVIFEEDPEFQPSCLYRVVRVKPLDCIEKLPEYLKGYKGYFQTVGTNLDDKEKLADLLYPLGVSRITETGKMVPSYILHHDGNQQILPLLRWVDIETDSVAISDVKKKKARFSRAKINV